MSGFPTPAQKQAIREAAKWYAQLASGSASADDQARWQGWYQSSELNRHAWQCMQGVTQPISELPAQLASATLQGALASRRQVLYGLAVLLGGGVLGTVTWRSDLRQQWAADYRSGVGERRAIALADGSQLLLDTDSAVDVQFDNQQRLLVLRRGQVMATTAADPARRPFMIDTPHGRVVALGTRFSVRTDGTGSEAVVLEKAVQLRVGALPPVKLQAGERARFTASAIEPVRANDASVAAWQHGSLIALHQPLGELVAELARYRPGILRCAPEVAALRVSGAFPVDDTDLALAALQASFPVQVVRRSRYWVTISARP